MTKLVYVTAPWCGPCRQISPIIDELKKERTDVEFVKVNADEEPEKILDLGVRSVPTFILYSKGKEIGIKIGKVTKAELLIWLLE